MKNNLHNNIKLIRINLVSMINGQRTDFDSQKITVLAVVAHPHVGWSPNSKSVAFTSHKQGNADVVIAFLPPEK